jgi:hypothetical protein
MITTKKRTPNLMMKKVLKERSLSLPPSLLSAPL